MVHNNYSDGAGNMAKRPKNLSQIKLPNSLKVERRGAVAIVTLARPEKRNALNDTTVLGLETFFETLPSGVKAVVLNAEGRHFSSGLDLSELKVLSTQDGVAHSRLWHRIFDKIEFGRVPVVTVMHGAVIGGGLELAAATHIRVAERSAYYALPEGSRGIFVGGGGSVRLPRIIGVSRMIDLMLTGRTYGAEEGQAFGLSHYLVEPGDGLAKGIEIAKRIAGNSPTTNFAIVNVLPRIAEQDRASGYVMESLTAAIAQGNDEAKKRIRDFLEKRAAKVVRK
jgi:enoyl-CoA hydratase/carnithine racemase